MWLTGSRYYRARTHDLKSDIILDKEPFCTASPGSIVIVDSVFIHWKELVDVWAVSIFLEVPFNICVQWMTVRDGLDIASTARYIDGQKIYYEKCQPQSKPLWSSTTLTLKLHCFYLEQGDQDSIWEMVLVFPIKLTNLALSWVLQQSWFRP